MAQTGFASTVQANLVILSQSQGYWKKYLNKLNYN